MPAGASGKSGTGGLHSITSGVQAAFIMPQNIHPANSKTLPPESRFIPQSRQSNEKAPPRRFSPKTINLSSRHFGEHLCRSLFVLCDSGGKERKEKRRHGKGSTLIQERIKKGLGVISEGNTREITEFAKLLAFLTGDRRIFNGSVGGSIWG